MGMILYSQMTFLLKSQSESQVAPEASPLIMLHLCILTKEELKQTQKKLQWKKN